MSKALTTFYLIRHGQTDWNKAHKLQGHADNPLNEIGEQQARELAKILKDVPFDLAFSSDLTRAKRTAEIIVLEKKLHVETTKLLRERHFGKFEGEPTKTLLAYFALMKELSHEERKKRRMDDDLENDEEVSTRLITFLRETAITHPGKKILVASHGGMLRMFLLHIGYMTYEQSDKMILENGGYVEIDTDGIDFFIKNVTGLRLRDPKKAS